MWNETRYREDAGTQKKGFATIQLSTADFFLERKTLGKISLSGKGSPAKIVQQEMLAITGIHLSVLFIKKGIANLGVFVPPSKRERLGANQRQTEYSVSREKMDHTQAVEKITSTKSVAKGDLLHGVSAIPVKSIVLTIDKTSVNKF